MADHVMAHPRIASTSDVDTAPSPQKQPEVVDAGGRERKATLPRHSRLVRATHWAVALSGFALLFSGFGEMPMYKRYKIIELPGLGWAADYETHLAIHYFAAIVFVAAIVFHLVYHWRRRERAAWPKRGDTRESFKIIKAMILRRPEPPQGKFLAEQRLAYAAIGVTALILIVTGLLKVVKNFNGVTFGADFLTAMTLIHTLAAMLFMLLVFAHLAAFLIKANWPLFSTMFTGRVRLDYARHRHSEWDVVKAHEAAAEQDPPQASSQR